MTPEERAVIEAAYRVSALADDPHRLFGDALVELDAAIVVHDRVAEPNWWQGPKPALPIRIHPGDPGRIGTELAVRVGCILPILIVLLLAWAAA